MTSHRSQTKPGARSFSRCLLEGRDFLHPHPSSVPQLPLSCHPERSEAPAERSRRTPCLPARTAKEQGISTREFFANETSTWAKPDQSDLLASSLSFRRASAASKGGISCSERAKAAERIFPRQFTWRLRPDNRAEWPRRGQRTEPIASVPETVTRDRSRRDDRQ